MKSLQGLEQISMTEATPGITTRDRAIGWLGHDGVRLSEIAVLSRRDIVFRPADDRKSDLVATVAVGGVRTRRVVMGGLGASALAAFLETTPTTLLADGDPLWDEEKRGFPFAAFRHAIAAHLTATGIAAFDVGDLLASSKTPKHRYG